MSHNQKTINIPALKYSEISTKSVENSSLKLNMQIASCAISKHPRL